MFRSFLSILLAIPFFVLVISCHHSERYSGSNDRAGPGAATGASRLPAPQHVRASDGLHCDHVHIGWEAVEGAARYEVFRAGSDDAIATTQLVAAIDQSASPLSEYRYRVRALDDACVAGELSAWDTGFRNAAPVTPTGVDASKQVAATYIDIWWSGVNRVKNYLVYNHFENDFSRARKIGERGPGQHSFRHGYTGPQTQYYWIVAENDCGKSTASAPATGCTTQGDCQ